MAGVTIEGTAIRPRRRPRMPRWLIAVAAVWALVLAGAAAYATFHGKPTVRDQTPLSEGLRAVDQATAALLAAGRGAGTVPAVGGYVRTDAACRITPVRSGVRYERGIQFFTAPGTENGLLGRIAGRLPKSYRAHAAPLRADAGHFVAITGHAVGPGVVRVVADTGCRAVDQPAPSDDATPDPADRAPLEPVLAALGLHDVRWHAYRVPCGARTVTAEASGTPPSLADALKATSQAPVVAERAAFAFHSGSVGVAVRTAGGTVIATATTDCA
jgi:hypothetical protein